MTPGDTRREVGLVASKGLKPRCPCPHRKAWPVTGDGQKQTPQRLGLRLRGIWPCVWGNPRAATFGGSPPALPDAFSPPGAPTVPRTGPGNPVPPTVRRNPASCAGPKAPHLPRPPCFSGLISTEGLARIGDAVTVPARTPAGGPATPRQPCPRPLGHGAWPRGQTRQRRPFPAPRRPGALPPGRGHSPAPPAPAPRPLTFPGGQLGPRGCRSPPSVSATAPPEPSSLGCPTAGAAAAPGAGHATAAPHPPSAM